MKPVFGVDGGLRKDFAAISGTERMRKKAVLSVAVALVAAGTDAFTAPWIPNRETAVPFRRLAAGTVAPRQRGAGADIEPARTRLAMLPWTLERVKAGAESECNSNSDTDAARKALDASWSQLLASSPSAIAATEEQHEAAAGGEYFLSGRGQKRPRMYRCGICGQPKYGHTCTGPPQTKAPTRGKARVFLGPSRHKHLVDETPTVDQIQQEAIEDCLHNSEYWEGGANAKAAHVDDRDALQRPGVAMYNAWALDGRDTIMELTHSAAFDEVRKCKPSAG